MEKKKGIYTMSLQDTIDDMHALFQDLIEDLEKAVKGNKTAAQRVRTGTIQLEKLGKIYRKQSMQEEKKQLLKKQTAKKSARKKTRPKR